MNIVIYSVSSYKKELDHWLANSWHPREGKFSFGEKKVVISDDFDGEWYGGNLSAWKRIFKWQLIWAGEDTI